MTEDNGQLKMLAQNAETQQSTHFLNHAKWVHKGTLCFLELDALFVLLSLIKGFLSMQVQFDVLLSSNILTADRVEVDLDATVCWIIKVLMLL